MSALWSLSEGKQTLPNVDCKRPCTMTQMSGLDKSKFCAVRAFYLCTLLPNGARGRDAHGSFLPIVPGRSPSPAKRD